MDDLTPSATTPAGPEPDFEAVLWDLFLRLMDVPGERVEAEIFNAQRRLCRALDLDRSTLWQTRPDDPRRLRVTHMFDAEHETQVLTSLDGSVARGQGREFLGSDASIAKGAEASQHFPWLNGRVLAGDTVIIADLGDLPEEAAADAEALRRFGTRSTVIVPLTVHGAMLGCLSFATTKRTRAWSATLVAEFERVAQVFAKALARGRTEEQLRVALESLKKLRDRLEHENVYLREEIRERRNPSQKGWVGSPKLIYAVTFWTVNSTDQRAIFGNIGYQFSRRFSVYGGLNGNPGTRSLQGSHPFWLGHDRVMADEFFRPFFGSGVWAQGEVVPGLWYNAVLTNNNSSLGVKSSQLDRTFTTGASMWWMPTTKEFGPRGAYGDWERHEKLATRFGFSTTRSPEQRFSNSGGGSDNTTIRLADSLNVFDTGALAKGVTVQNVDYRILSFDAGLKYRGIFLQTEIYNRWLDTFVADGPLPMTSIHDSGFYVQAAFFPVPKTIELYTATSQIYGDKSAGFSNSSEYLVGMNYYPFNTRNHRLNVQVIDVNRSPVSSAFGYYVGGLNGTSFSTAFSVFF